MAIQTNKISATQIDDVLGLFDQYMIFYKQPSAPEKYKSYLLQRLRNNEAMIYVAYNDNETPVGFVLNYQSFSSVSQGKTIILNDLFVCPRSRKKGIATQLVACSVALAKEVGAVRVNLATAKDNVSGQALYEKLGFIKDNDYFSYGFAILS